MLACGNQHSKTKLYTFEVHWFDLDECVKTDVVQAPNEFVAESKARELYKTPNEWPAPLCKATKRE